MAHFKMEVFKYDFKRVARFEKRDGKHFLVNTHTGSAWELNEDLPHRAGTANQERRIFDQRDVNELVRVTPAERLISSGHGDFVTLLMLLEKRNSFSTAV